MNAFHQIEAILRNMQQTYAATQIPPKNYRYSDHLTPKTISPLDVFTLQERYDIFSIHALNYINALHQQAPNFQPDYLTKSFDADNFLYSQPLNFKIYGLYCSLVHFTKVLSLTDGNNLPHNIKTLLDITQAFQNTLDKITETIFETQVPSPFFGLKKIIEKLNFYYDEEYKKQYNWHKQGSLRIWYQFKKLTQDNSRAEDIRFLSQTLSKHSMCNDEIRLDTIYIVISKIQHSNQTSSQLLKLLKRTIHCFVRPDSTKYQKHNLDNIVTSLRDFYNQNKIEPPAALSKYINEKLNKMIDIAIDIEMNTLKTEQDRQYIENKKLL